MPAAGEILRNARLRKGLSLEQVEAQTKIRRKFLDALESNRFEDIPGKFFVRSFAVQYGGALGVDLEELQAVLDLQLPKPEPEPVAPAGHVISVPPLGPAGRRGRT